MMIKLKSSEAAIKCESCPYVTAMMKVRDNLWEVGCKLLLCVKEKPNGDA